MFGPRRAAALEERLNRLKARATVAEWLFSAIAGLALRAAPDAVRAQIILELRASLTGGAQDRNWRRKCWKSRSWSRRSSTELRDWRGGRKRGSKLDRPNLRENSAVPLPFDNGGWTSSSSRR